MSATAKPALTNFPLTRAREAVDLVVERLMEVEDDGLECVYLTGAMGLPNVDTTLSLLFTTPCGSVCFVEDGSSTIWLTHWSAGFDCGAARRLSEDDDIDVVASFCMGILSARSAPRRACSFLN